MNAQTDTPQADDFQPEGPKADKPRRFTGRQRTFIIAGAAGALLLGGGTAAAFATDLDEVGDDDRTGVAQHDRDGDRDGYDDDDLDGDGLDDDGHPDGDDGYDDGDDDGHPDGDDFALPDAAIGEDTAVEAALAEVPGEVTEVDLEGTVDAPLWVVEVRDADGAEWDVVVDAFEGTIEGVYADDDTDDDGDDLDDPDDEDGDDDDRDEDGDDD